MIESAQWADSMKIMQSVGTKKLRNLSGQQKITQPLRTTKSRDLSDKNIMEPLGTKKARFHKVQLPLNQSIRLQIAPNGIKLFQMGLNRLE